MGNESITINFVITPPTNAIESNFNTLVLLMRELSAFSDVDTFRALGAEVHNDCIERIEAVLKAMKIKEFKGKGE